MEAVATYRPEELPALHTRKRRLGFLRVLGFALVTGDFNPIHFSNSAANKVGFFKKVVHGNLVSNIATDLIRRDMMKTGATGLPIIRKLNWKFSRAIYVGDEIFVKYEICRRSEGLRSQLVTIKASVYRIEEPQLHPVAEGTISGILEG